MSVEVVVALISFWSVIVAGLIGAGAALLSADRTAAHFKSQMEFQTAASVEAERVRFHRELRELRVTDLRSILRRLRSAIGQCLKDREISQVTESQAIEELICEQIRRRGEVATEDAIEDVRRRIRQDMREQEAIVDEPVTEIVRVLGLLQVEAPPSGPIRDALRSLVENCTEPVVAVKATNWGPDILAALLVHADAVEQSIDAFVIGDQTPASS